MATVDKVMAEQRAASFTKRSIKGTAKAAGLRLALSMVDLTTLEGKDTPEKVRSLCRKAVWPGGVGGVGAARADEEAEDDVPAVAAVCVYPTMVADARRELDRLGPRGRGVNVASVATGFPSGQYPLKVRLEDVRRAVAAGADEIDMVISRGAFLAGEHGRVADEIEATVEACGWREPARGAAVPPFAHLKVILETGELETLDNVRLASDLSIAALHRTGITRIPGAAFIKTSTGKVEPAATMPVTLVMLEAIRDHFLATSRGKAPGEMVGMKPAGGIRTAKQALHYLVMVKETLGSLEAPAARSMAHAGGWLKPGLFRFGASALVNDLLRQIDWLRTGRYVARYDVSEA
jgi:deoxyribose-phosphate aldolase